MSGSFPADFLWGVATSAYQIEGAAREDGRGESIWDRFARTPGKIVDGSTGDVACDHYHRYREDVEIMRRLGVKAYRFSIAWPRIFPEGHGRAEPRGLDFYRRLLDELERAGIVPVATLYHWDLPQALQDQGGWPERQTAYRFADYAAYVFEQLGDRIAFWITQNEPFVVSIMGHLTGEHAPGLQDPVAALRAAHHLLLSHGLAVEAFRKSGRPGQIGITLNLYPVHPLTDSPQDAEAARRVDGLLNRWFLDPVFKGHYPQDLWDRLATFLPMPDVRGEDLQLISQPVDFLGVNYYTRQVVRYDPGDIFLQMSQVPPAGAVTEMGWEVYPDGLLELLERLAAEYGPRRIYITENGAAFADEVAPDGTVHDPRRQQFLRDHLQRVQQAIARGVPVKGYFLWSILDNFEWAFGYTKRFGIVYVDYATQRRLWKDSAKWYQQVVRTGRLDG